MATNANTEFNKQYTDTDDIPQGGDTVDNSYTSRPDQKQVPVLKDETPVEQPNDARNPDSDEALGKHIYILSRRLLTSILAQDEAEAIDKVNIVKGGRTRGATKPAGTYRDPEGEADLPANDGTSAVR
ncbi:uncharacterized protein A1O9_07472 [Exophiala aquamarina CBS 119918]|uniref:Uncharacterized protein n=1 Tax=Exophiala aquamarina CBS 119918 TaxID=1182545 RepID=A0A072P835_9EURO|nr:uncharacterized protein A1O9_07472 [Exophiala aquamarina CBS 119918]KEF55892.1 hypothetical protein A1O9_07472 [Exophiala aquamarina CBS 119918]